MTVKAFIIDVMLNKDYLQVCKIINQSWWKYDLCQQNYKGIFFFLCLLAIKIRLTLFDLCLPSRNHMNTYFTCMLFPTSFLFIQKRHCILEKEVLRQCRNKWRHGKYLGSCEMWSLVSCTYENPNKEVITTLGTKGLSMMFVVL